MQSMEFLFSHSIDVAALARDPRAVVLRGASWLLLQVIWVRSGRVLPLEGLFLSPPPTPPQAPIDWHAAFPAPHAVSYLVQSRAEVIGCA